MNARRVIERARALAQEGHDDKAQALLRDAVRKRPRDAELRIALGIELDGEAARAELAEAAALAHDDPETLFRVASALRDADAHGAAVRAAEHVEALAPDDFVFAADLLHLRGLLARDAGDDARAEPLLRAAFAAEPEARGHGRWLAGLLIDHDRFGEALEVVEAAIEVRPRDDDLEEMRGWLLSVLDS